jgi:hypothetical protein
LYTSDLQEAIDFVLISVMHEQVTVATSFTIMKLDVMAEIIPHSSVRWLDDSDMTVTLTFLKNIVSCNTKIGLSPNIDLECLKVDT